MATINRDFFIAQFKEEVDDHVHRITQKLFQLEEQPGDYGQLIEEIFRIAHTLKGSARMMGYADMSALAHKMEDLLVEIRDGHVKLSATIIDLLFYCVDTVNYLAEGISKQIKRTANIEDFTRLFQDVLAERPVEIPHLQTQIIKAEIPQEPPAEAPVSPVIPSPFPEHEERQYVHIHTTDLDAILNLVGEVIINQYRYEGQQATYQELLQDLREHQRELSELQQLVQRENGTLPARISSLTSDLERSATDMLHKSKQLLKNFRTDGQHMRMAVNKLQEQVINVRMVPASRIFHLFPRLVRMTARRLDKTIDLTLRGEETKIDTRIIEEMRDPLIHLVQNAIHHGIESPEQRQSLGKNPTGLIILSARQEGNRIVLSVQDDGQGIHAEQIKNLAIKQGLISHRDFKSISEQEILEVLFHPGFSTSEIVDDIAGRGFGLNIVRTHVDRIQGEIEVHTQPGKGTEFVMKLPLTLTMMNALLVQVGSEIFAIPTIAVEKTVDISLEDMEYLGNIPVVVVDGGLLPLFELHQLLFGSATGKPASSSSYRVLEDHSRKTVIVLRAEERRIGFLVDDLVEEQEIVIKHLGPCLKRVRNVAGATTVRGEVIIILAVRDLVRSADAFLEGSSTIMFSQKTNLRQVSTLQTDRLTPRILLVDDAINTREVERIILESAGYEVVLADNGVQGLDYLQKAPFDLVITDIEMPQMNGLELTKMIKRDELLHNLPVIIISTRGTEEERQQGLQTGAAAYIVKGEFDEQRLLQIVDACLA
ncbi:cheA signal transduction histidine kinase [Candidatus Vecturithrix granuli]|uniref:histidine kinase n=1 Tax=Vecturithrix granuli TaxID=1499967 RepID=A0A081BYR6_VECG1|nr:cheA signal transduction histidine kinase [Candidatus Vecturithrix granuli]